jgi:hypothetical protein
MNIPFLYDMWSNIDRSMLDRVQAELIGKTNPCIF